ncbi:MAG: permease [Candidatus Parcubacteria bacterium]|nr:permease [Candidatus Parcubacteria bacterium]
MSIFYPVEKFADWLLAFTTLSPNDVLYTSLHFFIYDSIKIGLLLSVIVFVITLIRSYLPAQKIRRMLSNRFSFVGNILASLLGVITPFCSCSAVPLFIGLLEAGVPLGVTFSYLISAPMVNEIAVVLLFGMFGWKVALLYVISGIFLSIVAGVIFGKMKLEHLVEEYVWEFKSEGEEWEEKLTVKQRLFSSYYYTKDLVKKIFPYVLIGVALGAGIHGYLPEGFLSTYASASNPFAVIIVVLIGIPLYSNAAGTIPIVRSLVEKGLPMGTALAFMMSVTALSLPEMIILRNVLKPKLLALYFSVVGIGIILTGYLFNMVL